MRGLFLFSQLNDVLFMSIDDDLKCFINEQAKEAKLIGPDAISSSVDTNVLLQLFSPLVSSQRFMLTEVNNPYNSIRLHNNTIYVFTQFGDHVAMTIGDVREEREEYYQRKLQIFRRLVAFYHGPIMKQLHVVTPARDEKWQLIGRLLDIWETLYHEEQCFLVEALEQLSVNEDLSARCVKLLESAVSSIKSTGDKLVSHALMFVGCKLMAQYSSRSAFDLSSADTLLMILLGNTLHPWQQHSTMTTEPMTTRHSSTSSEKAGQPEPVTTSTIKTPGIRKPRMHKAAASLTHSLSWTQSYRRTSSESEEAVQSAHSLGESAYQEWTFLDDLEGRGSVDDLKLQTARLFSSPSHSENETNSIHANHVHDNRTSHHDNKTSHHDNKTGHHDNTPSFYGNTTGLTSHDFIPHDGANWTSPSSLHSNHSNQHGRHVNDDAGYHSYTVFLRTQHSTHSPARLLLLQVLPGVVMVIISLLPKVAHAESLVKALHAIDQAAVCCCRPLANVLPMVDAALKPLTDISRNVKAAGLDTRVQAIHSKWELAKDLALRNINNLSDIRLENILSSLLACVEDVFCVLYLRPAAISRQSERGLSKAMRTISRKCREELTDYREYMNTKAMQNITLASYLDEFPGLVHFIYVDRNSDCLRAPSIQIPPPGSQGKKQMSRVIKNKIWSLVEELHTRLALGFTSVMSRDDHLYCSYFLWFEDVMGNPLTVQQPYKGEHSGILPGIVTGNYYRKLVKECFPSSSNKKQVCCYELLCIHIGLVPTQYVLSHCRKMAAMLWEAKDIPSALTIL